MGTTEARYKAPSVSAADLKGLLLLNVGTPDDPSEASVRRYLREFLSDPRVMDLHPIARWLLLNLVILPLRPAKSAEAYRKVWTDEGSPLLVHGRALADAVARRLGGGWRVQLGMRYGNPSIASALGALVEAGVHRIVVFPLFPQYASSTTGSALQKVYEEAGRREVAPALAVVPPFFDDDGFLEAQAALVRGRLGGGRFDHVLFTFHGLPERHVRRADPTGAHCLVQEACCSTTDPVHRYCYRRQCLATASHLAERLSLAPGGWSVAFQSRLGRTPWLRPYTEQRIAQLAQEGVASLLVVAPSFTADCLETLEELGLRGRERFLAAGGRRFELVPALNASERWVETVARLARSVAP